MMNNDLIRTGFQLLLFLFSQSMSIPALSKSVNELQARALMLAMDAPKLPKFPRELSSAGCRHAVAQLGILRFP
jgi:hypothetical protein